MAYMWAYDYYLNISNSNINKINLVQQKMYIITDQAR